MKRAWAYCYKNGRYHNKHHSKSLTVLRGAEELQNSRKAMVTQLIKCGDQYGVSGHKLTRIPPYGDKVTNGQNRSNN
uniref:Transposase n=1 Tax=Steinernema glaseri TaxID=37863 RepID=A0A1I7YMR8_9BILA